MNPEQTLQLKEETLRWIFSILGALLVYLVVATIAQHVYHPNIDILKNTANQLLVEPIYVRPEPMEALLFKLGVITILPSLFGFYYYFSRSKWLSKLLKDPGYLLISILCIATLIALIWFDFSANNPYGPGGGDIAQNTRDAIGPTNFDYYFSGLFLGNYLLLYIFILVPLIAYMFLSGFKKHKWEDKPLFGKFSSVTGYVFCGLTLLAIVAMHIFYFPYTNDNKYDFNAVYYAMTQVYAGTPMLVNGFTDTYGLYPHFLNPLFQVIGLNILKFSSVMSVLLGLSFLCNFYFLRKFVSNTIILFLGFATILFFPYLDFNFTMPFDGIFSYYPIRYIIPSTLSCLMTFYLLKPSLKTYWTMLVTAAAFILWNPEMGLVCYISVIATCIYHDLFGQDGKIVLKKIGYHLLCGTGAALSVFYIYKLLILLFYGSAPDMQLIFSTIFTFGKLGFGLLPMSLVHPWNLMALILILGFAYVIVKAYKKQVTAKSSAILFLSIVALGYFAYFQGRSQNANFAISSGFCLMLLVLLGDELWKIVKVTNQLFLTALFIFFLFIISFSLPEIVFGSGTIVDLVYQEADKAEAAKKQEVMEGETAFIANNTGEKEKILVLTQKKSQGLFFDGNKRVSAFNPGFIDLFFCKDLSRLENIIMDSAFSIFIEPSSQTYPYMSRPLAALAATYEYHAINKTMVMLQRRKERMPAAIFFKNEDQQLLHRKYIDDAPGIRSRVSDAFGIAPVALGPQFSVEILFHSVPQMYPSATLIANTKDSSGFAIGNVFNTSNYFFMVNNTGFALPMPVNEWVYCVMNVYPDHVDLHRNGELSVSHPLPQPVRQSVEKVHIGNLGVDDKISDYVGAIAEVSVANKVLDKEYIQKKWLEIKQSLGK